MRKIIFTLSLIALVGAGCAEEPVEKEVQTKKSEPTATISETTMDITTTTDAMDTEVDENKVECSEEKICSGDAVCKDGKCITTAMMTPHEIDSSLKLNIEALGGRKVKLTWDAPAGLDDSNRFVLFHSTNKDELHNGKNFWFRKNYTERDMEWENIPLGSRYFRICITEDDNVDTCTRYSQSVLVEVE